MTRLLPHRFASLCFALSLATGALACDDTNDEGGDETETGGDGDPSGDGDGDTTLSHAADMQPIWNASCVSGCHEAGGNAETVLDLSGDAYDNIVSATSTQAPGLSLVEPGNSGESYLVNKLRGTQFAAGGLGANMPGGGAAALPEDTITLIEEWIDAGAAP